MRCCFFLALLSLIAHAQDGTRHPNILLVVADDMAFTDLGCFGSEIDTPNIDRLALQGVRFTNFHVSVSCSPTRSMLLSGVDNHQAGLGNMAELLLPWQKGKPGYEGHLSPHVASLAEVLGDAGYHTYMAGKWHLGDQPGLYPRDRGFERSLALLGGGASHWDDMLGVNPANVPEFFARNGKKLEKLPATFYSSRSYADSLMDSIREQRGDGKPFLAYLAFTAPHDPMHVPEPWRSRYKGRYKAGYEELRKARVAGAKRAGVVPQSTTVPPRHEMVRPWNTLTEQDKALEQANMQVYAGMVECMDYHLGRVLAFLRDIGEYDDTVIVFLSDNGPNPWVSEEYPGNRTSGALDQFDNRVENIGDKTSHSAYGIGWATACAGPLSYHKLTVGEGGIRSPLIIAGRGIKGAGRIDHQFVYVTDIMPTILGFAGATHPTERRGKKMQPLAGKSMSGVLAETAERVHAPGTLFSGEMLGGRWISDGVYKAVLVVEPYGSGEWELFKIDTDLGETRDLAKERPDLLAKLRAEWGTYAKKVGVVLPPKK